MPSIRRLGIGIRMAGGAALAGLLCALLAAPDAWALALAQDAQQPPPAGAPAAAGAEPSAKLSADELDSLVAPIALYPDPLIAQCLVASTYPIDIIAAQQWLAKNSSLKGEQLEKAAQQQDWDPSIQALVSLPEALKVLSENIQWTEDLGDAVLAQQADVMDAVQRMRKKAKDNGKLESSEQQKVETKVVETKEVIVIQPAQPEVIYVPSYNPTVVYPPPVYPYPPMYYPPYVPGAALLSFGVGMAWGAAISGGWGCGWGGGGHNDITINNNNNYVKNSNNRNGNQAANRSGNSSWQHNSAQRGGAPYKDKATASKYGGSARGDSASSRSAGAQSRQQQSSRSGGDRAGASTRSSGGAGSAGNRSGGGGSQFSGGGGGGGGDRVGSRSASPSSSRGGGGSAFGGSSGGYSGSSARSSSSRGSSSMSRSGGGRSGGGGGGRRR